MPKAKGKTGGKNRRRGKGDADGQKRELEFKEDGQEYAQVEEKFHKENFRVVSEMRILATKVSNSHQNS